MRQATNLGYVNLFQTKRPKAFFILPFRQGSVYSFPKLQMNQNLRKSAPGTLGSLAIFITFVLKYLKAFFDLF